MNILVPVDFSENAKAAIDFVFKFFKHQHANVTLVHTIKQPNSASGVMIRLEDLMMKDAENDMDELVDYIASAYACKVSVLIKHGPLNTWINRICEAEVIDLIVMGSKGENNISSKIMGSMTESVIRATNIPVLAIPADFHERIHQIVLATDAIPDQERFITDFLSVINLEHPNFKIITVSKEGSGVSRQVEFTGIFWEVNLIEDASIVNGIDHYLDENNVDILILFHQRDSRFDYLFNRSITKSILAKVQVPILVMRENKAQS